MNKKVKITQAQADAIDTLKNKFDGARYTDLFDALKYGYEVEPVYYPGDWVVHDSYSKTEKVVRVYPDVVETETLNDRQKHFRHATPSEIAQEKERRFFAHRGRKTWELKKNDLLHEINCVNAVVVDGIHTDPEGNKIVFFLGGDWEFYPNVIEQYKVACFAESRLDISHE